MRESRLLTASELRTGLTAEFQREITIETVAAFCELSGDWNPLHIDETYARQTNYGRRIVHGAFQVALASEMAGMYLPGRDVVVGSFQCRFPAPLYYPSRVSVQGEITSWLSHSSSGNLRVRVIENSGSTLTSEIHVAFSLHEQRRPSPSFSGVKQPPSDSAPTVLLTGASGGIGRKIAEVLSQSYCVIGVVRGSGAETELSDSGNGVSRWITADLAAPDWEDVFSEYLASRPLHAIVHAAWPTVPDGGLLDAPLESVRAQLDFGLLGTIRLARFLKSHSSSVARLIIIGSTYATEKPALNVAAYSLAKASIEHGIRLLAPELARSNITINVVAPSFVPVGMNSARTNRVILSETAKVPMGRLCSPEDVARSVEFLLSPGAAFISGQVLPLTGGQL